MVDIAPFRGLLYNREKAGNISELVSPPYDVINNEMRVDLMSCSKNNIVNLILPEGKGGLKYSNAAGLMDEWMDRQILVYDERPCFYGLRITSGTGEAARSLSGFIGLTRIEDYGSGKVLRHEKTLSGPREDRYNLLESCRANFGLIYTIYRDEGRVNDVLQKSRQQEPFLSFSPCYNKDYYFDLWKISGNREIEKIKSAMQDKSILIADGHHRYETSLMYSKRHRGKGSPAGPADNVLTLFMESSQEDLKIYPTHRKLSFMKSADMENISRMLSGKYIIDPVNVPSGAAAGSLLESLRKDGFVGFILYFGRSSAIRLVLKSAHKYSRLDSPDVFILHEGLIRDLDKGLSIKDISFDHDGSRVIQDVDNGNYDLGIFLNPPTVRDMEDICYSGGLMPQKSTFFQPKPCTGLVMYRF
jgi:uncharacterized protein (DUF1015 family)